MSNVQGDARVDYYKKAGLANVAGAADEMTFEDEGNLAWFVGHVRAATTGSPSVASNNHPILHDDVIGVHNGVIHNYRSILNETGRHDATAQVDSEAIFAAVNKWGVKEGLARIHGNMVSVFTDLGDPEALYIARTHGRPLVFGKTKSGSLVFASEAGVIAATGMPIKRLTDWSATNRYFKVVGGKITKEEQFRPAEPKSSWTPGTWSGGKGGISPYVPPGRTTPSSLDDIYRTDRFGGTYIGAAMWRVPDGSHTRVLDAEQYVEWAVERELASLREKARDKREQRAAAALPAVPEAVVVPDVTTTRVPTPSEVFGNRRAPVNPTFTGPCVNMNVAS